MFEKILYPTDFSDVSKKALEFIKKLKGAGTKEVVILHVIDERELESALKHFDSGLAYEEELEKIMEKSAKKEAGVIEAELKKNGFNVKVRIEKGIPFRDILKIEEEEDVSVTVIGSHGKSCVQEMLLGSVSEKVIRKSNRPVLLIRR
jgi:nucleotide-binding universal stress UspA family protein